MHKVTIESKTEMNNRSRPPYPVVTFRAVCTCGDHTDWVNAIGLCHGWEADHTEGAGALGSHSFVPSEEEWRYRGT